MIGYKEETHRGGMEKRTKGRERHPHGGDREGRSEGGTEKCTIGEDRDKHNFVTDRKKNTQGGRGRKMRGGETHGHTDTERCSNRVGGEVYMIASN